MSQEIRPLSSYFSRIVDSRKAKGLRHPLQAILNLCCVALMGDGSEKSQSDSGPTGRTVKVKESCSTG